MSDQEDEVSGTGPDPEPKVDTSFSSNGYEPDGRAAVTEAHSGEGADDGSAFLADLARAMQTTAAAEHARNAEGTEQRRQSHVDAIRAREALEAEELRELAKEDVKGIDAWSDGEIKRIKLERERRIAARREQLQIRLEEHLTVVGREVEAVEAAVAAYKAEIEAYFRHLDSETDPVEIAKYAGTRPPFPVLELIGPGDAPVRSEFHPVLHDSAPVQAVQASHADIWGAGAVEGSGSVAAMAQDASAESTEAPGAHGSDAVAAEAPEDAEPTSEGSEAPESDESQEPVTAVAEARVARSTGVGSWLRWPNSSSDQSDTKR